MLVTVEMALALVLLAGAGVMIRTFVNMYATELGANTDNVLTMLLNLPEARYPESASRTAFFERLEARLRTLPGVTSVAETDALPTWAGARRAYEVAGRIPSMRGAGRRSRC